MSTSPVTGPYLCTNKLCEMAGQPTSQAACARCGNPTHDRAEPGLQIPVARPPSQRSSVASTAAKGMEVGSRVMYGGFWVLATVLLVIGGFVLLGDGDGKGLLALLLAVLTGLYARYIFRGGRFRLLFW